MLRKLLEISSNIQKYSVCSTCITQNKLRYERNCIINKQFSISRSMSNTQLATQYFTKPNVDVTKIVFDDDPLPLYGKHKEIFLLHTLHRRLGFTQNEAKNILNKYKGIRYHTSLSISKVLNLLEHHKVKNEMIVNNLWLLAHEYDFLKMKLDILIEIAPTNGDLNDFVPLLKNSIPRLNFIKKLLSNDVNIPGGHRLYYISDTLKIEPHIIANSLVNKLHMFRIDFERLQQLLQLHLNNDIKPQDIILTWSAFRILPHQCKRRLKLIKASKYPNAKSWLITASFGPFDTALNRSKIEADILGENKNVIEALAARLNFDVDFTVNMLKKFPVPYKIRATTILPRVDYLLNEAGCTPVDIAQCPRILFHSTKTTKQRLNELKEIGHVPMSLITVCRTKTEYQKTIERILGKKEKKTKKLIKIKQ